LEAFAVPSKDEKIIEKVLLHIHPEGGDDCRKEVEVAFVWDSTWEEG